jgi:tripartite-type tricarboxylate transporter receptor subunit TctC
MRHPTRRRLLAAGLAAPLVVGRAHAATVFPSRPVRIVVPFTPGASTDQIARLLAQRLGDTWNRTVLVENRPGGATQIGTDLVAKAAPDGHTMLMAGFAFGVNPSLLPKPPYDALRDFAPVVLCVATPNLLVVGADQPMGTVAELLAASRSSPDGLAFASAGVATSNHLCIELLKSKTGANLLHVPYKGSTPAVFDVIAGRIPAIFDNVPNVLPHVKAGKLRALAVTTPRRFALLPQIPTMIEAGVPDFEVTSWFGLAAPARVPRTVVDIVNAEVNRILLQPDIRELLRVQGMETVGGSPEQFGNHLRAQIAKWAPVVKAAGLGG